MSDLISRSALLERLKFKRDHNRLYQKSTYPGLESAISQVRKAPAVDAVEVVRCKDCKQYGNFDTYKCKRLAFSFCRKFGNITRESDFCSYGERKDNGV